MFNFKKQPFFQFIEYKLQEINGFAIKVDIPNEKVLIAIHHGNYKCMPMLIIIGRNS